MRDFVRIVYLAIFLVLSITYSQDATTNIDTKYAKSRVSVQRCAFSASQNQNLTFTPPFLQNCHFGHDFDGT